MNNEPLEKSLEEKPQWVLDEILDEVVGACGDVDVDLENLSNARDDFKIKEVMEHLKTLSQTAQELMRIADNAEDLVNRRILLVDNFIQETKESE